MKKLLLSLTIVFSSKMISQNNLVIFSETAEKFFLIINGVQQNSKAESNVKITDLIQPQYKVIVAFEDKSKGKIDQTIYLMNGGEEVTNHEFVYGIKITKSGEYKIRPVSSAMIAQNSSAQEGQSVVHYHVGDMNSSIANNSFENNASETSNITPVNTSANIQITETKIQKSDEKEPNNANVSVNINAFGVNLNISENLGNSSQITSTSTTTITSTQSYTTTTPSSQITNNNSVNAANNSTGSSVTQNQFNCNQPMNNADFNSALTSIESKSFNDAKLKVTKQIVDANCLSTDQIKKIMELFSFEDSKLEIAKYAYSHTYDQKNYFKLNDVFSFESTIEELDEYLKKQK